MKNPATHYQILGTKITSASVDELHNLILTSVKENRRIHIGSGNIYSFNIAYRNTTMRSFLNHAAAVRCDGYGVVVGARLFGIRLAERRTWADWWPLLGRFCEVNDLSMFFLGGKPEVADVARTRLLEHFNDLQVLGTHHGYVGEEEPANLAVIAQINRTAPDILVVGMGMPLQETWLTRYRDSINAPVVLTGGACFDYLSGNMSRCPHWMSRYGLEWLYRLTLEPARMWRRYIIGNPLFFIRIVLSAMRGNPPCAMESHDMTR